MSRVRIAFPITFSFLAFPFFVYLRSYDICKSRSPLPNSAYSCHIVLLRPFYTFPPVFSDLAFDPIALFPPAYVDDSSTGRPEHFKIFPPCAHPPPRVFRLGDLKCKPLRNGMPRQRHTFSPRTFFFITSAYDSQQKGATHARYGQVVKNRSPPPCSTFE